MEHVKNTCDALSLCAAFAALVGLLPSLAALASLVWTGIRIYEWAKERK